MTTDPLELLDSYEKYREAKKQEKDRYPDPAMAFHHSVFYPDPEDDDFTDDVILVTHETEHDVEISVFTSTSMTHREYRTLEEFVTNHDDYTMTTMPFHEFAQRVLDREDIFRRVDG